MLNEVEQKIFKTIMKRHDIKKSLGNVSFGKFSTYYFYQKNFIICVIEHDGCLFSAGTAKRNPVDDFSFEIGEQKAFNEALKNTLIR